MDNFNDFLKTYFINNYLTHRNRQHIPADILCSQKQTEFLFSGGGGGGGGATHVYV